MLHQLKMMMLSYKYLIKSPSMSAHTQEERRVTCSLNSKVQLIQMQKFKKSITIKIYILGLLTHVYSRSQIHFIKQLIAPLKLSSKKTLLINWMIEFPIKILPKLSTMQLKRRRNKNRQMNNN